VGYYKVIITLRTTGDNAISPLTHAAPQIRCCNQLWLVGIVCGELQLFVVVAESEQGPNEKRLLRRLFDDATGDYNKLERPVRDENDPLVVKLSLVIQQIIDVVHVSERNRYRNLSERAIVLQNCIS